MVNFINVVYSSRSDDSSSINTIDQTSKTWMVRSAQGDYHAMLKMLQEDHRLAKHRDFTSGFTALHWAAKHGKILKIAYKLTEIQVTISFQVILTW